VRLLDRNEGLERLPHDVRWLPFGNGRSYGDSCLNDEGLLIDAGGLDRFIAFDLATGRLVCESGLLLSSILELAMPRNGSPASRPARSS